MSVVDGVNVAGRRGHVERGERRDGCRPGVVGGVPWAPIIQKLADSEW